jgi:hypothetical protein
MDFMFPHPAGYCGGYEATIFTFSGLGLSAQEYSHRHGTAGEDTVRDVHSGLFLLRTIVRA